MGAPSGDGGVEETLGRTLERKARNALLLESEDGALEVDSAEGNGSVESTMGGALEL